MILPISANFILDPYFYQEFAENGNLRSVTVNGAQYCEMLEDYVIPQLAEMEVLDDAIWMQDGAPAHTTRVVTDLLRREFGNNRVISRKFPLAWPARSPDLTPCDFFMGIPKIAFFTASHRVQCWNYASQLPTPCDQYRLSCCEKLFITLLIRCSLLWTTAEVTLSNC